MSRESGVSAIERGDLFELQHVLEESEWDIGSEPLDSKGQTALHIACTNGHLDIVQYLVNKKGCSVTLDDVYGQTTLMLSLTNNHWMLANFLLQNIPNSVINELEGILTSYNKSVLTEVAKEKLVALFISKQWKIANILLQFAPNWTIMQLKGTLTSLFGTEVYEEAFVVSFKNDYFRVVEYLRNHISQSKTLQIAITNLCRSSGNLHMVHYLFHHCQCTMPDDMSEVHIACIQGDVDTVKTALESNGPSLLGRADRFGMASMHYATLEPNVLRMIVQYAGEKLLNIPDSMGNTPLHYSIKYECIESVTILVEAPGCDLNLANHKSETPLIAACKHGNSDSAQLLIATGVVTGDKCDFNGHDQKKATPSDEGSMLSEQLENEQSRLQRDRCDPNRSVVCHQSTILLIEALVASKNCDLNIQDGNGDTALHIGVENAEIVKCLLESGRSRCDIYNHKGLTSFHKAIAKEVMESIKLMLTNGINILQSTNDKIQNAPIHIACKYYSLSSLKLLLSCKKCDPNQQNAKGNTALHIACGMRKNKLCIKFLEVLTSTPGINPAIMNHKGIAPFGVVDSVGNTLLHIACAKGNIRMAKLLLINGADVLKPDRHGDAPIHIACKHTRLDILKLLLNFTGCNPNQQNASGDTALHIVCRETFHGQMKLLNTLTSIVGIDPEIVNHEGHTPIEVKGISYSAIDTIKKLLKLKRSSVQAYLKIFVVGNSGNGKSTLIKAVTTEASQLLKYAPLSKMKYVKPGDVPPHTAGIVPIPFNSKHFGNAVLYDFAGQHEYYSSHAAVMENLILPSPPLFLLLIDISKSKEVIREELVYWWHFIDNQSQKAVAPPHVILAGSHKDLVESRMREELEIMIIGCIKCIPVIFKFVGFFPLDCRKLASRGLSALLTQLNTTCQTLRGVVNVNLHCHILNALLRAPEIQDLVYCKLVDIRNKIESDNAPLPKAFSQLVPLLASLNDQGYILLLQNHTDESKSWVILKPDVLLSEVNGSVFAPEGFKEHFEFAMSTGVVTSSKLKHRFTVHDHDVIVEYMTHLEFCFRIKDQHTLDMITNNKVHESAATEEYYFFPALVRVKNPTNVCQPNQSIDYECGWLYKCSKETEQLTTRFLHVLILRLAFACEPPDDPTETQSVVLLRSCSVWKHGIAWWTNDGIEVIVEVGLQCRWIAVMLRCPATERVQCAELRSKVISTVLKTKTDFCPAITMKEYLIAPSSLKYPFEGRELFLCSMSEVAKVTINGKKYAKDTKGDNSISLLQLLPFEPYYNMGDMIWKFFCRGTSVPVTSEELTQLAGKCHDKVAELMTAFKPDISSFQRECVKADCTEVERCVALFHILQRRGRFKTWKDFQQEFSRFSIFREQIPLANDDAEKDMDILLVDDKHESSVTSDSVRVSEDVARSLPSPVPKSLTQSSHTFTDSSSTIGPTKERSTESEKESHSQPVPNTHMSSSATDLAVTGLNCKSTVNISSPDVIPTDIHDQPIAGLKPSLKDLANQVIPTVCPMWRDIGLQLNLNISILNEIRANCLGDVRECCTIMFDKWLKQDTEASWRRVLDACRRVKDNLSSGPDEPCTKDHIKALTQLLISTLPVLLATF